MPFYDVQEVSELCGARYKITAVVHRKTSIVTSPSLFPKLLIISLKHERIKEY